MRLFDTPGADSAYERWLEPPKEHIDDCICERCHETVHIENPALIEAYAEEGCALCASILTRWSREAEDSERGEL